jgi:hypothetical protein
MIVVTLSGMLALSVIEPTWAAPVLSNTAAVRSALPADIIQARTRNRGGAVAAGVAVGMIGALIASSAAQNRTYYYGPAYSPGYYYPPTYGPYSSPYGYAPYYGPGYYGPYPYGYGHYGYHDGRAAVAAGAMIGAMIGAAAASNPGRHGIRYQPYLYRDPLGVW